MTATVPEFGTINYIVLGVYVAGVIAIGLLFAGRQNSIVDYFLAGRRLPWLAVAMSMYASVTSAMTFMGLPGLAYGQNISLLIVCLMSPLIAPILIFRIYPLYRRLNLTTSYEYIALRFGRRARVAAATLFVLARLGWLGTVIYAPALALHVTTGISMMFAVVIIGVIATVYCVLGGLSAVVWTDVPQFIIMISGVALILAIQHFAVDDGLAGALREAHAADKIAVFDWSFKPTQMTALAVAIAYAFMLIQDYGVDQVSVQRLLAVKSDRGVGFAIAFNALTDFFIIGALLLAGLGFFAYYNQHPGLLPGNVRQDMILPWFVIHELPDGISGLIIAAIFAAAMSSVDSGLNSLTTVILHDVAAPLCGGSSGQMHSISTARILTAVLGIAASVVALFVYQYIGGIIKAFYTFMGLFSAPVLALFLLGMVTRRAHFNGWLIGAAVSITAVLVIQRGGWLHEIYFFPFSAIMTVVIALAVSGVIPDHGTNPAFTWREVMRQ